MASKKREEDPAFRLDHDAETVVRQGMSPEGTEVDEAETLASTGDADGSFQEIASGSATGVGIDREEFTGSAAIRDDGLPSEDENGNDGDDSWLQDMPRDLTGK